MLMPCYQQWYRQHSDFPHRSHIKMKSIYQMTADSVSGDDGTDTSHQQWYQYWQQCYYTNAVVLKWQRHHTDCLQGSQIKIRWAVIYWPILQFQLILKMMPTLWHCCGQWHHHADAMVLLMMEDIISIIFMGHIRKIGQGVHFSQPLSFQKMLALTLWCHQWHWHQ